MILTPTSYGVTLLCYRRDENGAICLTPVALSQIEATSPQEAAHLAMEEQDYRRVDRVEVTLPDGAVFQRNNVLGKNIYSVAMWRTDRVGELPLFENQMQADSPLLAALSLMRQNTLTYVASVSVRCPDGSMWRKKHLRREKGEENDE